MRIHTYAKRPSDSVPAMGELPYWLTTSPEPLTVLAFCDDSTRALARKPY